jgi:hypothetical protein
MDPSAIKDPSKSAAAKQGILQGTVLIMAGVAGASGVYFSWRRQWIETARQIESATNATEFSPNNLLKQDPGTF